MMAVGKSTIGRALSDLTGWPYVDNDELVARSSGRSTAAVLAELGEPGLRRAEAAALHAALAEPVPVVAGVAGGVIEDPKCRRLMSEGAFVVHLRAPLGLLAERIRHDEAEVADDRQGRPWIDGDPMVALARLHGGRAHLYEETADLIVDVAGRTPQDIAREIVSAFTTRT